MRRRRHRHRRHWLRRLRQSFRGFGVMFVLALVVAAALVWAVLPALDRTFNLFVGGPDASTIAEIQRRAKER